MNMKNRNPEIIESANSRNEQNMAVQNKTRILIISDNSTLYQELSQLIKKEADLEICIEPEGSGQAQTELEKQQVDLAIVDITSRDTNCFRVSDTTRFQYSNIPVILLSMQNEAPHTEHTLPAGTKEYFADQKSTEQIIKAIRYVQSLLRSKIFGFTLAVKIEGSLRNDH
jgi:DNA-binding NarL/FixJ family response regulator